MCKMSEEQLTFKDLEQKFLNLFGKSVPDGQGENWCFVKVEDDEYFHYELIQDNNDCYIALHLENGAKNRDEIAQKINEVYENEANFQRSIIHSTWYASYYWTCRCPIKNADNIKADLGLLTELVDRASINNKGDTKQQQDSVAIATMSLDDVLEMNLVIPSYQRAYRWREKNIKDFLVDIQLWQRERKGISYHLGSIILKERKDNQNIYYDVVDGQQRLTTMAIVQWLHSLQSKCEKIPLLLKNSQKDNYREEEVQTLLRAKKCIEEQQLKIDLATINLSVVVLGGSQPEELAYTFFSNSNSTGKHLSDYDLLKTHHLRYIANDTQAERFSKQWHDLERSGLQDDLLQKMLFRLRKWASGESFCIESCNLESRELFHHYKSTDTLRDFPLVAQTPFDFNSALLGGAAFFTYTEYYRKRYQDFIEHDEIKELTSHLSYHNYGRIYFGIKAIAFLFFCKFGDMHLREAVYLLAYRLSKLRNETRISEKILNDSLFATCTKLLSIVTNEGQFFAYLNDIESRYTAINKGPTAIWYWTALDAFMKTFEKKSLAISKIEHPYQPQEDNQ